jgi:hypothetical protein
VIWTTFHLRAGAAGLMRLGDVARIGGGGLAALREERGAQFLDGVRTRRIEALPLVLIGPEGGQEGVFAVLHRSVS